MVSIITKLQMRLSVFSFFLFTVIISLKFEHKNSAIRYNASCYGDADAINVNKYSPCCRLNE